MNQLQLRLEVKAAAQNWVASIMQQYGVPASIMEEALQNVQLSLKDLVMQEMLTEIEQEQSVNTETPIEEEKKDDGHTNKADNIN